MTKEVIIIALIICLIYYYYQQNNQPHIAIDKQEHDQLIQDLKRQVHHYQKLYENRVANDLSSKKKSIEIQTDNILGDHKETQTPLIIKYSRNTQTSLTNDNMNKLISQWNQVSQWAEELGIDTKQKWNLALLKGKIKQELATAKKKPPTSSRSTQTSDDKDLENTLDNLIKNIQNLNQQL